MKYLIKDWSVIYILFWLSEKNENNSLIIKKIQTEEKKWKFKQKCLLMCIVKFNVAYRSKL